jgi:hypothetical protein
MSDGPLMALHLSEKGDPADLLRIRRRVEQLHNPVPVLGELTEAEPVVLLGIARVRSKLVVVSFAVRLRRPQQLPPPKLDVPAAS